MQTKGYNYYEKKQKDFIVIKSKLFLDMPRKTSAEIYSRHIDIFGDVRNIHYIVNIFYVV